MKSILYFIIALLVTSYQISRDWREFAWRYITPSMFDFIRSHWLDIGTDVLMGICWPAVFITIAIVVLIGAISGLLHHLKKERKTE